MEASAKYKSLDAGALQLARKGLQFAAHVGKRRLAQLRHHDTISLDAERDSIHCKRKGAQLFVCRFQTLQNAGMISLVQVLRAEQDLKVFEAALHVKRSRLSGRIGRDNGGR